MPKLLFIYNPNSGKGNIRKEISLILEKLSLKGYQITVFPTARSGDADEMAKNEGHKFDLLVCAGGDGTFNEVARGLMESRKLGNKIPVIGYIPVGTVNDFATSLDIPKDVSDAVDVIIYGMYKEVDIGSFHVGDQGELYSYFTYVAAFGAFTEVSYETSQDVKNVIGKAAYFLEGVKSLQKIRPYHLRITYDDYVIEDTLKNEYVWSEEDILFYMKDINEAYHNSKYKKEYKTLQNGNIEEYIYIPNSSCFYKCIFRFSEKKWYLCELIVNTL